ncbi:MAG TPA: TonB-dependent receptor [Caulobacterales bacterium]|nr:TonB-dependent receptor [Caulobacterales bacterium]
MSENKQTARRSTLLNCTGLVLAGLALCAASPAFAQSAQTANDQAVNSDEIVVTGSRLANRGFEAPTPVAVIGQDEVQFSGTQNIENLLSASPQFVPSTNGGATANTVPGGNANVNLRNFGPQRNLVLVNGRRFAIQGPDQTVDLNTIPSALVSRTEIVTGGSSAVYGSDAITGVVNFIMRDDYEGLEASYQRSWDSPTETPTDSIDLTFGGNIDNGRGNVTISFNYLNRRPITRAEMGGWTRDSLSDGCVTAASYRSDGAGVPLTPGAGQTCRQAGGIPGFIAGGSGDIPNGRWSGIPIPGSSSSNVGLDNAYSAAGLSGMGAFGFTFNDAGSTARPALDPQDRYNLALENYLVVPQERYMVNAFSHYDFNEKMTGYLEVHFSNNTVNQQLAPTNIGGTYLLNVNNPYLSAQMQEVLHQLDLRETSTTSVVTGTSTYTNAPNDGLAALTHGRRLVELGDRFNSSERVAWRVAAGFRGDLGDLSENFLHDLHYDLYYLYARTDETDLQTGNASKSRFQAALLSQGANAPVCNTFGANMSAACVNAIRISATNVTKAEMQGAAATLTGSLFDLPAGPIDFALGTEWREQSARFVPDSFLASGDVVGFNPALPTNGSESVEEVFGEVRVPILAHLPGAERLNLNLAYRYSDYDLKGVGGVDTYSYGLEWSPVEDLTVRGQFQHAIRAPNVGELFGGNATNFNNATDPCGALAANTSTTVRNLCIATGVPTANVFTAAVQSTSGSLIPNVSGGNPSVGPEESDTKTFGLVARPRFLPGFVASVDWYDIDLDGAIAPLGGGLANVLNICYNIVQDANSQYCQAIQRNPADGSITQPYAVQLTNGNTGGIKTSGVDFAASYEHDLPWGVLNESSTLTVTTNWTHVDELIFTPIQAFPNVTNDCTGAFGQTCGEPVPEWKGVTRVTLSNGPLALSLRHRYVGEVTDDRYALPLARGATPPAYDSLSKPVIDAQHYFDLSFRYDVGETIEFFGGVNNIEGKDPPVVASASIRANTWPATYDILGRQFFLGATVQFH